jgi:hypothetical protein
MRTPIVMLVLRLPLPTSTLFFNASSSGRRTCWSRHLIQKKHCKFQRRCFMLVLQELAQLPRAETAAATLQVSVTKMLSVCNHGRVSWSDWHCWAGLLLAWVCPWLHSKHAVCD